MRLHAMITDTSWMVVRHPHAFLPNPWQTVLCKRDMTIEVMPGVTERRFAFVLDSYSGRSWHREGSGTYEYWTDFPKIEQWCPPQITPPLNTLCLLWLHSSEDAGLQIGQVGQDALGNELWQIRDPYSTNWKRVFSKNVGGWLLMPPDQSGPALSDWNESTKKVSIAA